MNNNYSLKFKYLMSSKPGHSLSHLLFSIMCQDSFQCITKNEKHFDRYSILLNESNSTDHKQWLATGCYIYF